MQRTTKRSPVMNKVMLKDASMQFTAMNIYGYCETLKLMPNEIQNSKNENKHSLPVMNKLCPFKIRNKHQQDSISNDSKNTRKDVNPIVHHSSDVSIVAIISFTFWAWGDVENTAIASNMWIKECKESRMRGFTETQKLFWTEDYEAA
ncbi:hypothetical protein T08_6523 [Trichinella sp. T8]|nr:hypothetical protein T08_6523 [Trichinella sp. T8]